MGYHRGLAAAALCAALAVASNAEAQNFSIVPPPAPADNQAVAMRDGKQLVGLGNKCIQAGDGMNALSQYSMLTLQDCNSSAPNQRFKFVNGRMMTAASFLTWTSGAMGMREAGSYRWQPVCVVAISEWGMQVQRCSDAETQYAKETGRLTWSLNGNAIRSNNTCLDVRASATANGTPIIHWNCNGDANQRWALR
ncbi:MAG: RICIN domain-containing protein [Alphaproteobacteria bacterium]